jgi:hypothetical protein
MYEMQGPHVAGQDADLPIPRLASVCQAHHRAYSRCAMPGPPGSAQPLGSPPRPTVVQVVREFLLPQPTAAQAPSLIFSRIFCRPQNVHCYPPMTVLIHRISTAICTSWGWRVPNRVTPCSGPITDRVQASLRTIVRRIRCPGRSGRSQCLGPPQSHCAAVATASAAGAGADCADQAPVGCLTSTSSLWRA